MRQRVKVLFVAYCDGAGGATAAAIGADPGIEIVARCCAPADGAALIEPADPDVVVFYAGSDSGADCGPVAAAAAARGVPLVRADAGGVSGESYSALRERVKRAGAERSKRPGRSSHVASGAGQGGVRLIAIGASTGGVEALERVLSAFPQNAPPTVVVQHMPAMFTASFAARLDALCEPSVREAWDGAPLDPGCVYIAPGGPAHLEVQWSPARRCRLTPSDPVNRHRPSVDVAFASIVRAGICGVVGVLLTGMGRDGAEGLRLIRAAGGRTIAQDSGSSTVYGMPRAALENGAVDSGTALDNIAAEIFTYGTRTKEAL